MTTPRLDRDYGATATEASRSVLLEVMTILGEYREALILIGGWGPYFLLTTDHGPTPAAGFGSDAKPFRHIGSIDITSVGANP